MADRNTPQSSTFEEWRQEFNELGTDVGDIANLTADHVGTPTDVVEALGTKANKGFSVAMAIALG
ncbi:MAG: hypothetical protein QGH83_09580 [Candidatus Pacebacteria bacterium]|jgi:hypothetical protein|nr:hypothetical protein [Candidatus Paceibacterota bacterium]|tara:strand:+ start:609 stop:803 length:195 start_codon:yes stop_codon:yes gene_type:complete